MSLVAVESSGHLLPPRGGNHALISDLTFFPQNFGKCLDQREPVTLELDID